MRTALLAAAAALLGLPAVAQTPAPAGPLPLKAADATVIFKAAGGASRGMGRIWEGPGGVVMRLELSGLAPGWHAIHFHATGDCSDAKFEKSGGHINHSDASKKPHGLLNPDGPDFGDLPNIHAGKDGKAMAEVYSPLVALRGEGARPALLDGDGSAVIVHANLDDYRSQPIGGAGARLACAVVTAPK